MVLGVIVVLIVGSLFYNYVRNRKGSVPEELLTQNPTNQVERSEKTHKVAKGENLWMLAEKYYGDGYKWTEIATENKVANASVIEEGQELVIPNLNSNNTDVANAIDTTSYTVERGDSLWTIAVRAYGDGYKWVEIARDNKLTNPDIIHAGNILSLPK